MKRLLNYIGVAFIFFTISCTSPEQQLESKGYEISSQEFKDLYFAYLDSRSNDINSIESFFKLGFNKDSLTGRIKEYNRFECYPVQFKKLELLKLLFKYGVVNKDFVQKETGDNLLQVAINGLYEEKYSRSLDVLKFEYIIEDIEDWEFQHLHSAVGYNTAFEPDVEIVEFLLSEGVSVNHKNDSEQYPLYSAVNKNDISVVSLMIKYGADVNSVSVAIDHEWTPLITATAYENFEIVKLLVEHGAFIPKFVTLNFQSNSRYSAYSQAEYNDYKEILDYFDIMMSKKVENSQSKYPWVYKVSKAWAGEGYTILDQCNTLEIMIRALEEKDENTLCLYGEACHSLGNKDDALSWFEKLTNDGYYNACFSIVDLYYTKSDGTYSNPLEIIRLMNKAIELGDQSGQAETIIGVLYFRGKGVELSYEIAREYFVKAKDKENSIASDNIAACDYYLNGDSEKESSSYSTSNTTQNNYQKFCTITFEFSITCMKASQISVNPLNGSYTDNVDLYYNSVDIDGIYTDQGVAGNYEFTWQGVSDCGVFEPSESDYKSYSGTFPLDGQYSNYTVYISDGFGGVSVDVTGW